MSENRKQSDRPGKDKIRNPGTNAQEKSDRPVVPGKTENKAAERSGAAEPLEGRGRAKEKAEQNAMDSTQSGSAMGSGLDRLRQRAKEDKNTRFTALLHHVTVDCVWPSDLAVPRSITPGPVRGAFGRSILPSACSRWWNRWFEQGFESITLDPAGYLRFVLERIADHPVQRIAELLPWNVALVAGDRECAAV